MFLPNLICAVTIALLLGGGGVHAEGAAPAKEITVALPGGETMTFVWIEAGSFTMGSPESEPGRLADEGPQHEVTITKGYYLGKTEITQAQWTSVMGSSGTQKWQGRYVRIAPNHPAVYISWEDAQTFARTLSFLHSLGESGKASLYRLPTEAEWEYAARAGTTTRWSFGDDEGQLGDYACYEGNTWSADMKYAQPVTSRRPNLWGLHGMHGNVWEWVQDWYGNDYYSSSSVADPAGPATGNTRVLRGGGFSDVGRGLRSACRFRHRPSARGYSMGMRLVRTR